MGSYNELSEYISTLNGLLDKRLTVGIISKADDPVEEAEGLYKGGKLTLGELAWMHEFGAGYMPARSILQVPLESNEAQEIIESTLATGLTWKQLGKGSGGEKQVLDRIGKKLVRLLEKWYKTGGDGTWEILSEEYEERKVRAGYSDTPLHTTGQLGEAFEYRID